MGFISSEKFQPAEVSNDLDRMVRLSRKPLQKSEMIYISGSRFAIFVLVVALLRLAPPVEANRLKTIGRLALLGVAIGPRPMILPVPHAAKPKDVKVEIAHHNLFHVGEGYHHGHHGHHGW